MTPGREKITAATSSASLYDNVNNANATPGKTAKGSETSKPKEKQNETCQTTPKTANVGIGTVTVGSQVNLSSYRIYRLVVMDAIIGNVDDLNDAFICRSTVRKRRARRFHQRSRKKVKTHPPNRTVPKH